MKIRSSIIIVAATLLGGFMASAQADRGAEPMQLTALDGRTYRDARVLRAEPDGLVISYEPERRGIALAKVRFQNLPESLRSQYNYKAETAAQFEAERVKAMEQWRRDHIMASTVEHFRALAELNRSLAGDAVSLYWVTLDQDGRLTTHGFTGNVSPFGFPYVPAYPNEAPAMPMVPPMGSQ